MLLVVVTGSADDRVETRRKRLCAAKSFVLETRPKSDDEMAGYLGERSLSDCTRNRCENGVPKGPENHWARKS
jgi:hypothetical protein